jgi:hypothetical protein
MPLAKSFNGRPVRHTVLTATTLALAALSPLGAHHAASRMRSAPAATVADLAWFSGSWRGTAGPRTIEEHWTEAASNGILGMSRTVANGRMVAFEYLRIMARAEGIFYVAQPNGRPATEFQLTKLDGQRVLFENPAHDFPKRIMYIKNADGSLTARIDGGEGVTGGRRTFHFQPIK